MTVITVFLRKTTVVFTEVSEKTTVSLLQR